MKAEQVISQLREMANPADLDGMARFGIETRNSLGGIQTPKLKKLAKEIGKDHELAGQLWTSGIREARLLACMVADPHAMTEEQMERWVDDFDSWDVCDSCCGYLFNKTPLSYSKALEWSGRQDEFVKRAGFALMAFLAVHDKKAPDEKFLAFLPAIKREAIDERNFVKKAVNWALRQIGKRNLHLNAEAISTAVEIQAAGSKAGRWIAADALRELTGDAIQARLNSKKNK